MGPTCPFLVMSAGPTDSELPGADLDGHFEMPPLFEWFRSAFGSF